MDFMEFREAVVRVLKDAGLPLTPQEIRDRIKQHFPSLYDTAAQRRSVESKHHSDVDHALLAQIYTFVGADPRFERDESVTPYRVALRVDEGGAWTDEELAASVQAYLEMHERLRAGELVVKKRYYDSLAERFGRTSKAFEYRMQNISYVLTLLGRQWLPGLKPARNVGANVAGRIEAVIAEAEGRSLVPVAAFEIEVKEIGRRVKLAPTGNKKPRATTATITQYARDPAVKAWVLAEAKGICECCMHPAPFKTADGPFLEVHHVHQLADRGPDTVANAVAICPNCHRRLHYGIDAYELIDQLYERIARLIR
jgi:5-methylcytosine-specific restriction enzyme A